MRRTAVAERGGPMPVDAPPPVPRKLRSSRFVIARLQFALVAGGVLLIASIFAYLGFGQWRRHFLSKDLPHRLGIDIQQQADGVDYTQSRKGKTLFKIHAARAVQMKLGGKTLLHDVRIELYGEDGKRTDTISGSEFQYDQSAGVADAPGAVEITLMRPGVTPAVATLKPGVLKTPSKIPAIAGQAGDGEIHVKTSGLRFDQKSQVATTTQRVDFTLQQGSGSSTGATYSSADGHLILDRDVVLRVNRVQGPVTVHAGHADFQHKQNLCDLSQATADYSGGTVATGAAEIHFRDDGSVVRLDGSGGVDVKTITGSHLTSPRGTLDFDEKNHPRHGLLEGGAWLEANPTGRHIEGTAQLAKLEFDGEGDLSSAHLERGVQFASEQQSKNAKGQDVELHRTWHSQTADLKFAKAAGAKRGAAPQQVANANGMKPGTSLEPTWIHGDGGVVVTSDSSGEGATAGPSKLTADVVEGQFAPGSVLKTLDGKGHASFEQRNAQGAKQTSSSDQLTVHFIATEAGMAAAKEAAKSEIESVVQVGHVVLVQEPAPAGSGARPADGKTPQGPLRATAARLDYDGIHEIGHLSGMPGTPPRVESSGLELTATRIDFMKATGDALAHGDVKASWTQVANGQAGTGTAMGLMGGQGNGPAHAIAAEAELRQVSQGNGTSGQNSQEVVLHGAAGVPARLWQGANSVSAPTIVLNQKRQTLAATAGGAANPVKTVLVSNANRTGAAAGASGELGGSGIAKPAKSKTAGPSVIRVTSGELHYSEGERLAVFGGAGIGPVTAETSDAGGSATLVSDGAEVTMLAQGVSAAPQSSPAAGANPGSKAAGMGNSRIDRMTAQGHVTVNWPGRKGTGEKLVYSSDDGTFTLTGTGAAPPRMTDQVQGTVTGSALIFHSGDDSVTVEGDGGKTVTETQSRKKH